MARWTPCINICILLLYPLELACDIEEPKKKIELDAKAPEFPPKRKTAEEAKNRLKGISIYKDDEL